MRVLITGAGGLLGHDLVDAFGDTDAVALRREDLDVTDAAAVDRTVPAIEPDVVLHAAAYTKVDACETEQELAWRVNAGGAWNVARACASADAAMVYISTDYVFDGRSERPYTEFDPVNPQSVYGRTKWAGEHLVRQTLTRHQIVRTSWLQGAHGACFVSTMLRLFGQRDVVRVVDDQVGNPTFAFDLAPAVRSLVDSGRPGTYHLTNTGSCTWHELACAVQTGTGAAVTIEPTTTAAFGAPAPRPRSSMLDRRMAHLVGLDPLPEWQSSLRRMLALVGPAT